MAKRVEGLTARKVATVTEPGRYADGRGLYLHIGKNGAKSWVLRFMLAGKAREMGLGAVADVTLQDARRKAGEARALLDAGCDPLEARREEERQREAEKARAVTFKDAAGRYIAAHRAGWRNEKHAAQWDSTLTTYVYPVFGEVAVADVDTGMVLRALEPIWHEKPETATRVRGRIEAVLDWAKARGYRDREAMNPAQWKGHLSHLLPARSKVARVEHHAALPWREVGAFMVGLRNRPATAARALEFAILTAARSGEVFGATWEEVDLAGAVWTVPGERMKAGRDHRVPLSPQAVALLVGLADESDRTGYVFKGMKKGRPLSGMAMLMLLRRMERGDLTAHGFRSTFRDWAAEATAFPGEVAEAALAHIVGDKVEAAYRRGDLFDKRRRLMEAWADHCDIVSGEGGNVVPIRAG